MNSGASSSPARASEEFVAQLFEMDGWKVQREPAVGKFHADLIVKKKSRAYVVEIKAISEGRRDRVIPLLSQAILQAQSAARKLGSARPMAIVHVGDAKEILLRQVDQFAKLHAPDVAIAIVADNGVRHFIGDGLEGLQVDPGQISRLYKKPPIHASNMFSDLNQWMLKVLLAPEIPEHLLSAPRDSYRNVSELARAAGVSVMSAFRLGQQLREEGFLDESSQYLKLVRRKALFERWQSAGHRSSPEIRMRFLVPGATEKKLRKVVSDGDACLGLFAAADALNLGHVSGVQPHVYVEKLPRRNNSAWKGLVPSAQNEPFDLVLRQAPAPKSLFRGAVHQDGIAIADVLQIWLDVSAHPSRGHEQAELIRKKALRNVLEGSDK
ncbi:MAG TPA: restriction endonuclease [Dokdonella sp.]|nr:restriction endonuclease [Dokdonella sp.]HET9034218.1 restriction endonuclease [Dokdonella sp.]